MKEHYLLAVGLLTGFAIPASALPQMPSFMPENSKLLRNLPQNSEITGNEQNSTNFDISPPEFSHQQLSESLFNPSNQISQLPLISGHQLYHRRLAALKTGKIYTRIDGNTSPVLPKNWV